MSGVIGADRAVLSPVGEKSPGVRTGLIVGREQGLVHLDVGMVEIAPGGSASGHYHPYEESFHVLDGSGLVSISGRSYRVGPGDFGMAPLGAPHAWSNPGAQPLRFFRVRSPLPRAQDDLKSVYWTDDATVPTDGREPPVTPRPYAPVSRFRDEHLPPPGPISIRGHRGPNVSDVRVWMLIDDMVGAVHHTMFIVEFVPIAGAQNAANHYHPFEEAYFFLSGSAIAHLDGGDREVGAGDVVYAATNELHGYTMTSEGPVRWIEVQAPAPPPSGAFFFPEEWNADASD